MFKKNLIQNMKYYLDKNILKYYNLNPFQNVKESMTIN